MNCKDCKYEHFEKHNGNPNRYYCLHPVACKEANAGARMISRTDRHSEERKHKTAPRWCPGGEVKCKIN